MDDDSDEWIEFDNKCAYNDQSLGRKRRHCWLCNWFSNY